MHKIKVNETTTLETLGKNYNYDLLKFADPDYHFGR